ncbi:MAG: GTPase ObgE [Myxococcota bacterium]
MDFIDEVTIEVRAGDGGNGCIAFRREKFVPLGGPSGGDGGDGGSVVLQAQSSLSTLFDLRYRKLVRAGRGEHGRGKDQYGKRGKSRVAAVPIGTQVFDLETGELLADLCRLDQEVTVAKGGRGGRGNIHFATPYDRAPRRAEPGGEGQRRKLRLELKLLADVGVVGFPNTGKSTLISVVSRARPKIADYPFTTLTPNLGVVSLGDSRNFVMADIPGIIEGASEGAGLGLRFLRHVERCRCLLHLITVDPDPARDPLADLDRLLVELECFDPALAKRPMIVGLSKTDLPEVRARSEEIHAALQRRNFEVYGISSATREGLDELITGLEKLLIRSEPQHPSAQEAQEQRSEHDTSSSEHPR